MYQQNDNFIKQDKRELAKEEFNHMIDVFKQSFDLAWLEDTSEWDLNENYITNHACIWNKPSNIGKECVILQKNSHLALVAFDKIDLKMSNIYRLEDLSLKT